MVFHIMPQKESKALSRYTHLDINSMPFFSDFISIVAIFLYKLHFLKDEMRYISLSCTFPVLLYFVKTTFWVDCSLQDFSFLQ